MVLNYQKYNESVEPPNFHYGEKILVNGIIDKKEFEDAKGEVIKITNSKNITNMSEKGLLSRSYQYIGKSYLIRFENNDGIYGFDEDYSLEWWCPPWNLSKIEKSEIKEEDIEWF
jgi:hypothetical protein